MNKALKSKILAVIMNTEGVKKSTAYKRDYRITKGKSFGNKCMYEVEIFKVKKSGEVVVFYKTCILI